MPRVQSSRGKLSDVQPCNARARWNVTCDEHLFIPQIMPKDFVVTDAGDTFVEYEDQDSGEIIRNENNSQAIFDGRMQNG